MWLFLLLTICSSLNLNLGSFNGVAACPKNEIFVEEPDPCNTCEHLLGYTRCSSEECDSPGCDCKPGYYRNRKGRCVTKEECHEELEPNDCECNEDEEFLDCSCESTCKNRGKCSSEEYMSGCFCKKPLVRNDDGECVRLKDCEPGHCGRNEIYKKCGSACQESCSTLERPQICTQQCVEGCFCKKGFVRNDRRKCVRREDCPPIETCPKNETYKKCGSACPPTCKNRGKPKKCSRRCVSGCFCNKGLVRNDKGKCVKLSQCPPAETCPKNETYKKCGSACPPTCKNRGKPKKCSKRCVSGCFCNKGLVRNDEGKCVKLSQCPPTEICSKNEVYKECGSACPPTCENYGKPIFCTLQCVPGCFCKEGLVRNNEGICVNPKECPPTETCPENESYEECGTACPPTCKNRKPQVCTKQCVSGCFCNKGLVRNDEGVCVDPKHCPAPETCPKNEIYKKCGTACPPTCKNRGKPQICTKQCVSGCFCKKGLVRNDDGICVRPEKCPPPETCPNNENYQDCGTACPPTCKNRGKPQICTLQCVSGCFCNKGLVRNDKGICVKPEKCPPPETCPKNENYQECGTACPPTCKNRGKPQICTLQCVAGCFCNKGLVRNDAGVCVKPEKCSPTETCPENESYSDCGNPCAPTCSQPDKPLYCKMKCQPGCFCNEGFVRNDDGICVLPEDCSPHCDINEEIVECVKPRWCNTCEIKGLCKIISDTCKKGCDCKKGYYRNKSGKCIPESECPVECPLNEQYVDCVKPCNDCKLKGTCDIFPCKKGCDCIDGYFRDETGLCIPADACPIEQCGINEVIVDCAKPKWCNTCEIKGNCKLNESSCRKGCDCKEGYYRNKSWICIPESQCNGSCPPHEEYSTCVNPCNNCDIRGRCQFLVCNKGCDCIQGYRRNEDGICIPEEDCPQIPTCGEDEVYLTCGTACPRTCDSIDKPQVCIKKCVKGCFCRDDLVRNSNGQCVKPDQCHPVICGKNEEYQKCGTACPATCKNRFIKIRCIDKCVEGCFCKKGFVRNGHGLCIRPEKCPPVCPPNETYSDCVNPCNDCQIRGNCNFLVCNKGCDCIKGYHRDSNGKCIPANTCPDNPPTCGENEVYNECGSACPATCSNSPQACSEHCVKGCFCKDGFVRNDQGECIEPEKCPQECGLHEEIVKCAKPKTCNTCEIRGNCSLKRCIKGCDCISGYYRNKSGICIPESECPRTCGKDEVYQECGTACPDTCSNLGKNRACTLQCVPGCFCREGLVRNESNNKCVKPEECPQEPNKTCGPGEEYYDCIPTCKNTCENCNDEHPICSRLCKPGCACKKGLVKRKDGKCVLPEDCEIPPKTCDVNEEYLECGTACPQTCSTIGKSHLCTMQCVPGCFCREGFVRNAANKCIKIDQCPQGPPEECPENQKYYKCIPSCKRTCMTYNSIEPYCNKECVPGCFCKDHLVMNKYGECVKPEECPEKGCGLREQYYECIPYCQNRCNPPDACDEICLPGCFCRPGLVLRDDGKCVRKQFCDDEEPPKCAPDQQYYDCVPRCGTTCKTYKKEGGICHALCLPGCFCKPGYVLNDENVCVRPEQCPQIGTCGNNEVYNECGTACPLTCANLGSKQACTLQCVPGCFCKEGFVRNEFNECVKPEECRPVCRETEQYYDCIPYCKNTCNTYGKNIACKLICKPGCFCKPGLVLNDENLCVPPELCPNAGICSDPTEQYYECTPSCKNTCKNHNNPGVRCACGPPGCYCKEGLVKRESDGLCVRPEECDRNICGLNEQYYDCMPDCVNRCNPPDACAAVCRAGCFCKEGLFLNDSGECVKKERCGNDHHCGVDQKYYDCIPECGNTCQTYFKRSVILCPAICKRGCFCKPGLVLNDDNVCVLPEQCPKPNICGLNEQYYDCMPDCVNRCNPPDACVAVCRAGCFCKEGLFLNDLGECVEKERCGNDHHCGVDQKYYDCIPECGNTCQTYFNRSVILCPAICKPGCFCKPGLVLNDDNVCVLPEQCPNCPKTCPKNERYEECGTACPPTCKNHGKPQACTEQCVPGCFCDKGLVRNDEGVCVKPEKCPPPECRETEQYYDCIPDCTNTCDTYQQNIACKKICKPGCFCKPGLVLNNENLCVKPELCPNAGVCPDDTEQYYDCTPSCKNNCKNYNNPGIRCGCGPPGCFCKQGLVKRENDGRCVLPEECDNEIPVCGPHETYYKCVPTCNNTCENYNQKHVCPLYCRSGCACKKGFVRRKDGKCVRPHECETQSESTETSISQSSSTSSASSSTKSEGYQEGSESYSQSNSKSSAWSGAYQTGEAYTSQSKKRSSSTTGEYEKESGHQSAWSIEKSSASSGVNEEENGEVINQSSSKSFASSGVIQKGGQATQSNSEYSILSEGYKEESGSQYSHSSSKSSVSSAADQKGETYTSQTKESSTSLAGEYQKESGQQSALLIENSSVSSGVNKEENGKVINQASRKSFASSGVIQEALTGGQTTQSNSKSSILSEGYKEESGSQYSQSSSKSSVSSAAYQKGEAYTSDSEKSSTSSIGEYQKESGRQSAWSTEKSSASSGVNEEGGEQTSQSTSKSAAWSQGYQEENGKVISESRSNAFAASDVYQEGGQITQSNSESSIWSEGYQEESGSQYSQSSSKSSSSSGANQEGSDQQTSQSEWFESSQGETASESEIHESNSETSSKSEFHEKGESFSTDEEYDNWIESSYDGFSTDDTTGSKHDTEDSFWATENTESITENSLSYNEETSHVHNEEMSHVQNEENSHVYNEEHSNFNDFQINL